MHTSPPISPYPSLRTPRYSGRRAFTLALGLGLSTFALCAFSQTKWDLASAYPASNFHTENLAAFAADVDKATGGQLKITAHSGASLYKAPEIKRAVQSGQAQLGEVLLANFENESPLFGVDGVPFLATSYKNSRSLYDAQRPVLQRYLDKQACCCCTPYPGPRKACTAPSPSTPCRTCAASSGAPTRPPLPRWAS